MFRRLQVILSCPTYSSISHHCSRSSSKLQGHGEQGWALGKKSQAPHPVTSATTTVTPSTSGKWGTSLSGQVTLRRAGFSIGSTWLLLLPLWQAGVFLGPWFCVVHRGGGGSSPASALSFSGGEVLGLLTYLPNLVKLVAARVTTWGELGEGGWTSKWSDRTESRAKPAASLVPAHLLVGPPFSGPRLPLFVWVGRWAVPTFLHPEGEDGGWGTAPRHAIVPGSLIL